MFFHIGKREIVSIEDIIGFFNGETIELSDLNEVYQDEMKDNTKTVIIDKDDEVIVSEISSTTLIQRKAIPQEDILWQKKELK